MVPTLEVLKVTVETVLVGLGEGTKNGIALVVPQNFAKFAMRDVAEDGTANLVSLWDLKLQDLKKISLLFHPQEPPSGQVTKGVSNEAALFTKHPTGRLVR